MSASSQLRARIRGLLRGSAGWERATSRSKSWRRIGVLGAPEHEVGGLAKEQVRSTGTGAGARLSYESVGA